MNVREYKDAVIELIKQGRADVLESVASCVLHVSEESGVEIIDDLIFKDAGER